MGKIVNIPRDELYHLYIEEEKTNKEIAQIYGCCSRTVKTYIEKYGIPLRTNKPWLSEQNRIKKKKYNEYILSGEYGIGYTTNTKHQFYFDLEDYDKIKDVCWYENTEGYLCGRYKNNKIIKAHQLIMNDKHIDHINHNTLDNRKQNLRKSNDLLNSRNRSLPSNNKSGCKGVCWKAREGKWRAYITHLGKHIELGLYDDLEEAIKVRKKTENELYKEWSYYNSISKEDKE